MDPENISGVPLDFLTELNLRMSVENFMRKLLEAALKISPDYDRGSVIMKTENEWRYVAWVGFPDEIADIVIDEYHAFIPDSEDPLVIERIYDRNSEILSENLLKIYRKIGTPEIKKTISVAIKNEEGVVGAFFLDSIREDAEVSESFLKSVKNFGKIASIFTTMKIYQENERRYQKEIIMAMIKVLEARDRYTVGHSERVAKYAVSLAKELGLDRDLLDRIYWASLIHDIGKIAVPEHILLKPSRLSPAEYELVKAHTLVGERIVRDYNWLKDLRKIIRNHHERWDGSGYPDGLKGREIPIEVRAVSLADAFDAMTSDRSYRKAMDLYEALEEMKRQAGHQFDPEITGVALEVFEKEYRSLEK